MLFLSYIHMQSAEEPGYVHMRPSPEAPSLQPSNEVLTQGKGERERTERQRERVVIRYTISPYITVSYYWYCIVSDI